MYYKYDYEVAKPFDISLSIQKMYTIYLMSIARLCK